MIRKVDFRKKHSEAVNHVVKFTKYGESVDATEYLRLAMPEDYRKRGYERGISDELDASLQADMTPYFARHMSEKGFALVTRNLEVSTVFSSYNEPWLYCASCINNRSNRDGSLESLRRKFTESKGEDSVVSAIEDADQWAKQIGIEFASGVELDKHIKDDCARLVIGLSLIEKMTGINTLPWVDMIVWVEHGPVCYEDRHLVIETDSDMPTLQAIRACFTKRTEFSWQREYRFAVSTSGRPLSDVILLKASPELHLLSTRIDGD